LIIENGEVLTSGSGGVLRVEVRRSGKVVLRGHCFSCQGCRSRVRRALRLGGPRRTRGIAEAEPDLCRRRDYYDTAVNSEATSYGLVTVQTMGWKVSNVSTPFPDVLGSNLGYALAVVAKFGL
jgi:hypothetical protein